MTSSPDVIVIGAGVLGLCTAAELGARGHAVTVVDPGLPNASAVAAGMIAPALESLLEEAGPDRAALLRAARDLWPDFAETHDLTLHREGAEWRGPDAAAAVDRLRALGFSASQTDDGLTTSDDWRIDVASALTALARAGGTTLVRGRVARLEPAGLRWRVRTDDGRVWFTPAVVLATGTADPIEGLPETIAGKVAAITPIRGQITTVGVAPPTRVVRAPGVYVAPGEGGVAIGATMEPGRRDLAPDPVEAASRVAAGLALIGARGEAGVTRVGVRGATADGLPIAGGCGEAGLWLALAPRRNGWLLGPLVARIVADAIEDRAPLAEAAALDPLRLA